MNLNVQSVGSLKDGHKKAFEANMYTSLFIKSDSCAG